jgi:hypothetical protein
LINYEQARLFNGNNYLIGDNTPIIRTKNVYNKAY